MNTTDTHYNGHDIEDIVETFYEMGRGLQNLRSSSFACHAYSRGHPEPEALSIDYESTDVTVGGVELRNVPHDLVKLSRTKTIPTVEDFKAKMIMLASHAQALPSNAQTPADIDYLAKLGTDYLAGLMFEDALNSVNLMRLDPQSKQNIEDYIFDMVERYGRTRHERATLIPQIFGGYNSVGQEKPFKINVGSFGSAVGLVNHTNYWCAKCRGMPHRDRVEAAQNVVSLCTNPEKFGDLPLMLKLKPALSIESDSEHARHVLETLAKYADPETGTLDVYDFVRWANSSARKAAMNAGARRAATNAGARRTVINVGSPGNIRIWVYNQRAVAGVLEQACGLYGRLMPVLHMTPQEQAEVERVLNELLKKLARKLRSRANR